MDCSLEAFYLKIWLEDDLAFLGDCPWEADLELVRRICDDAGIALHVIPFQQQYYERVVDHAIAELKAGRTPSPDILCNSEIKFGAFYDEIDGAFDRVVTGHYAGVEEKDGVFLLKRARDGVKDQTYFLSHLNQAQLSRAHFPLGVYVKSDVRRLARELDLPNQGRKDSQGLCFLGKIKYNEFVKCHLGKRPGRIVEIETGKTLGDHDGYWFFTVGQRRGIGLAGGPWYVVDKVVEDDVVLVSHQDGYRDRARRTFVVTNVHWIAGEPADERLTVKVRHGPVAVGCTCTAADGGRYQVQLDMPDTGIAAGQSAVFYDGDYCLGRGIIANSDRRQPDCITSPAGTA